MTNHAQPAADRAAAQVCSRYEASRHFNHMSAVGTEMSALIRAEYSEVKEAITEGIDRLQRSHPPKGGATEQTIARLQTALKDLE